MCSLCQTRPDSGSFSCAGDAGTGAPSSLANATSQSAAASLPSFTLQAQAAYLTDGYWNAVGWGRHAYDVRTGGTIAVDLAGLGDIASKTARVALDAWTAVSGLRFSETTGLSQIKFTENQGGAWTSSQTSGQTTLSSTVNVATGWVAYGAYYLQTFIHEIGHALGLGHGGNYNGSADFATNAGYQEDSWQLSVMSYFSQDQNPYARGSHAELATPMMADIVAIHDLYGTPAATRLGDDTYGDNRTLLESGTDVKLGLAQTIFDAGGIDTFDFSLRSANQRIDLGEGRFSDIDGRFDSLAIALGTVIENAFGGSGHDTIVGNAAANLLIGNGGNDQLDGGAGNDKLNGGVGDDILRGGTGNDALYGFSGDDTLFGGDDDDLLNGGDGHDTLHGEAGNDRLDGLAGNDVLFGGAGDDLLSGGAGDDTLRGEAGNDRLDGGAGADRLAGGTGDDVYVVTDLLDTVVEQAGEGRDSVVAFVSHALADNVEVLNLAGSAAIDGTGNNLANRIVGNGAANVLTGLGGQDTITGGGGADIFVFQKAEAGSQDRILDFSSLEGDKVGVDDSFFGLVQGAVLDASRFVSGASAVQGTIAGVGQFVFNTTSHLLSWDADGSGDGTAVALASFDNANLSANDFLIV